MTHVMKYTGTFGVWYKARDKKTKHIVAVKKLTRHRVWSASDLRLANISLALAHRHVRQAYDVLAKSDETLARLQQGSGRRFPSESRDQHVYLLTEYCDCELAVRQCIHFWIRLTSSAGVDSKCARAISTVQRELHQVYYATALDGTCENYCSEHNELIVPRPSPGSRVLARE